MVSCNNEGSLPKALPLLPPSASPGKAYSVICVEPQHRLSLSVALRLSIGQWGGGCRYSGWLIGSHKVLNKSPIEHQAKIPFSLSLSPFHTAVIQFSLHSSFSFPLPPSLPSFYSLASSLSISLSLTLVFTLTLSPSSS